MHLGRLDKAARHFFYFFYLEFLGQTARHAGTARQIAIRRLPSNLGMQVRKLSAALHLIDAEPLMANFWSSPASVSSACTHGSECSLPFCREERGCVLRVWPSSSGCLASRGRPRDAGGSFYICSQEAIVDALGKPARPECVSCT